MVAAAVVGVGWGLCKDSGYFERWRCLGGEGEGQLKTPVALSLRVANRELEMIEKVTLYQSV